MDTFVFIVSPTACRLPGRGPLTRGSQPPTSGGSFDPSCQKATSANASQRIPAPSARAIDARIATAQVSRVSLSFTLVHLITETSSEPATGRPRFPWESRGPWLCVPASRRVCPGRTIDGGRFSPSLPRCQPARRATSGVWVLWRPYFGGGAPAHRPPMSTQQKGPPEAPAVLVSRLWPSPGRQAQCQRWPDLISRSRVAGTLAVGCM